MIITVGHRVKDAEGNIYQLTKDIGQGGFGCVYQAVRENDGKIFAVKTLLNSFKDKDDFLKLCEISKTKYLPTLGHF